MEEIGKDKGGLFIVWEGVDGAGKGVQQHILTEYIKQLNKYNTILETHEPWKSEEIKAKLEKDKGAYSDGAELSDLFIDDRAKHTKRLIRPNLEAGVIVSCDRYKMSTCAYQWVQGVSLQKLLEMHEDRSILTPDITFYIDVPYQIAIERTKKRIDINKTNSIGDNSVEKFEKETRFIEKLVEAYRCLSYTARVDESIFGIVIMIDGTGSVEEVSKKIKQEFDYVYKKRSEDRKII